MLLRLRESKINNPRLIDYALAKCRERTTDFLPSVGVFFGYCLEGIEVSLNLPTEHEARRAMNSVLEKPYQLRDWGSVHPAVYWTFSKRSIFDWKTDKEQDQQKAFAELWKEAKKHAMKGLDFPLALPSQSEAKEKPRPLSKAANAQRCKALLGKLNLG